MSVSLVSLEMAVLSHRKPIIKVKSQVSKSVGARVAHCLAQINYKLSELKALNNLQINAITTLLSYFKSNNCLILFLLKIKLLNIFQSGANYFLQLK